MYPVRRPKKQHRTPLDQDLFKPRGEDTNTSNERFDSDDDSDWLTETEDDEAEAQHEGASVPSGGFVPGVLGEEGEAGGEEEEEEDGEGREGGEGGSEATIALSDFPAAPTTADTYRQVTTRVITDALGRIRARSARMRVVDLATLPYEATAWRNKRAGLLKAIYGRTDLELLQVDVEMVEKIGGWWGGGGGGGGYGGVREVCRGGEGGGEGGCWGGRGRGRGCVTPG